MEIVKVTADTAKYFSGVASKEALGLLSLPNAAALGAVEGKDAIGILIFSSQGKTSLTIEWLYVDEEHRGIGAGAELIEKLFDIALKLNVERVCVRIVQDEDFEAKQLYMLDFGFGWSRTLPGEWNLTAKELYLTPFGQKAVNTDIDKEMIKPLSEVSQKELSGALKKAKDEGKTILYDVGKNRKYLDSDISTIAISKGKVIGMLLMHRSKHVLFPVVLWAEKENVSVIANLIGASMKAGVKSLKGKDVIRITVENDRAEELLEKIVGKQEEKPVYMMQAPADALKRAESFDIDNYLDGAYAMKDIFSPEDIPEGGFTVEEVEVR